jgi:hypothetical protein
MDTPTLVSCFEDGTLHGADFHHIDHMKIAWHYLERYGRAEALRRIADGLLTVATRMGKVDKFNLALTRAWVAAVDEARRTHPDARSLDALVAVRPDLLDPASVTVTC